MAVKKEDAATVGRAIYNEKIRDTLGPEDKGKVVVIDIYSGDYEIDDQHWQLTYACGSVASTRSRGQNGLATRRCTASCRTQA